MNTRITAIAFLISFAGHAFLLAVPGISPRIIPEEPVSIQIQVEIPALLPRIHNMGEEKKLASVKSLPDARGDTKLHKTSNTCFVQKMTAREDMLRYQDMVKQKIQEARRYPAWAARQGLEGNVRLGFTVMANGSLKKVYVVRTSGSNALDREAVATIKRASAFPHIPASLNLPSLQIGVTIVFSL